MVFTLWMSYFQATPRRHATPCSSHPFTTVSGDGLHNCSRAGVEQCTFRYACIHTVPLHLDLHYITLHTYMHFIALHCIALHRISMGRRINLAIFIFFWQFFFFWSGGALAHFFHSFIVFFCLFEGFFHTFIDFSMFLSIS